MTMVERSPRQTQDPQRVSGRVLEWARERASLSREEVADRLDLQTVDASTVERWERDELQPSPAQARRLARWYRIPQRWLMLEEPPEYDEDLGIVDYRTPALVSLHRPSLNLRSAIEHALAIQAWVVDHRARAEEPLCPFVAAKSTTDSPKAVARYIEQLFDVASLRRDAKDSGDFFARFRQRVEDERVLVIRMGHVANKTAWSLDPDEFKGFTLTDEDHFAPLIFINRKDHEDAQIFTFVHELAHVVTGGSGVSNEDIEDVDVDKPKVELFCDAVAEEVLVPKQDFEQAWQARAGEGAEQLGELAKTFKVPALVLARRAASARELSTRHFHQYARVWRRTPARKQRAGGPPPAANRPAWYGRGLAQLLARAACTGHPAAADALDLLGVKLSTARVIAKQSPRLERRRGARREPPGLPPLGPFEPVRIDLARVPGTQPEL